MKIGFVQAPASEDLLINLSTIKKYVKKAKTQGCAAVCFPECSLTGYAPDQVSVLAIHKSHECICQLSSYAAFEGLDILAGFMEADEDRFYIAHGIFKATGEVQIYRKTHLGEKEARYFSAGDSLDVFELSNGAKAGFQLCVETHFPDITQTLSLRGAEIIFAPHAVPKKAGNRKEIWSKYIPARSYDNRVFFACCNLWDSEKFAGGCMVTDPAGNIIAEDFTDTEGLLVTEINFKELTGYHSQKNNLRHRYYPQLRRKELYD